MSLKRWNAKRDANEAAIFAALRKAGALVMPLDKFDALVCYRGKLSMIDCKVPNGRATATQEQFRALGWPLTYVRDEMSALKAIGAIGACADDIHYVKRKTGKCQCGSYPAGEQSRSTLR